MDLPTMRTQVRRDLKDETPTAQVPTLIDDCDVIWSAAGSYTVVTLDSADKQQGAASMKANIYAGHTTGLFCFHNISSFDLTGYQTVRFWIKSSINQNAGDLQINFDNSLGCGSPVKTLDIPALAAEAWSEIEITLGDTSAMNIVVSIGLSNAVDNGSCLIHLDNVRVYASSYKWSDDELDRHIAHALKDVSYHVPLAVIAGIATTGIRSIDISLFTNRITVLAVEYPISQYPPSYQRFSLWADTINLLGDDEVPDGAVCRVYYGKLHTMDVDSSTLPEYLEDLLARGAQGYALQAYAAYSADRSQPDYRYAQERAAADAKHILDDFRKQLRKVGRYGRLRMSQLYIPATNHVSKTTDWGP